MEELETLDGIKMARSVSPNWHLQLGTLGSGNHFIEVTLDEEDRVWLFLHSGSRGVGNRIAMHHIRIAQEECQGITLPDRDLAYLEDRNQGSAFWDYMDDLWWAQRFAYLNRAEMMDRVAACFERYMDAQVRRAETINCHHNYTVQANIEGEEVWLSRKGAIDASEGVMGLIPGSMGTASYVVQGKGNADALWTAPHGAGRMMSRGQAKRSITMEQLERQMEGIEWSHRDAFLDEAPDAYKDVDQVIVDAADLVEVRHTLHQILNVKGN